jgi:hypothetical protein
MCPLSQDPLTVKNVRIRPDDKFCGMGAIPFPSILNGSTEQALWCRGCEFTYEEHAIEGMDFSTWSRLVPHGYPADQYLEKIQYRAGSKWNLSSTRSNVTLQRQLYPRGG